MPFAHLADADAAWPEAIGAEAGFTPDARRFDSQRRPSFRYSLGSVSIEELPHPVLGPGGAHLVRRFWVRSSGSSGSPDPAGELWLRAASGERIERSGEGWRVDGRVQVRATGGVDLRVRETAAGLELVAPLDTSSDLEFDLELDW